MLNFQKLYNTFQSHDTLCLLPKNTLNVYGHNKLDIEYSKDYIFSPYGLEASCYNGSGTDYTPTDHLGSILYQYLPHRENYGDYIDTYTYDAWGRKYSCTYGGCLEDVDELLTEPHRFLELFNRGFTGHEHLDAFGLINMNGRLYDPLLGRMLSPDPYVPNTTYTQDFNRYTYARNNPLSYVDPDGEFVHLIVGVAIGGLVNLGINLVLGNVDNFGEALGYFGIGALGGALGAGIGVGIQTASAGAAFGAGFIGSPTGISTILSVGYTTSFMGGFAAGAAGGFASGFITGLGNGLMGGEKFGDALSYGVHDGLIAGGIGGVAGGLWGGINAMQNERDFWGGKSWETTLDYSLPNGDLPPYQQSDPKVGCTQKTLISISDYLGRPVTITNMTQGEDFAQLAIQHGFNVETIMPNTTNVEHFIGAQLKLGNPSAITYNNAGTMHTVGVNKIQMQQVPRVLGSGYRTRTLIQVMDPLYNTYQNLPISIFRNGYIRVVIP